ncbi:MAG: amino acid ABC transporter ATP-binding protein [Planctomycetaceae bacterium]|nr:amino acid ABC transporter ATP-binding protein [Planctomycetaceae bacterium]
MIRLTDIYKRYEAHTILKGVNLTVAKGEVCVLLGPSGGGKSTLLRTINGLETFDGGQMEVAGVKLPGQPCPEREAALLKIRQKVGMVFQQFNLFPHLTVLGNIIEAPIHVLGTSKDQAIQKAMELLDRVGLKQKADSRPASLSGGQQQRVAIARTLAMNPDAILFDEPTSALDPNTTAEVIDVMQDLAQAGQGMIVVTHGMHFARTVAHTIHILHSGTIIESGPPAKVFDSPSHEVTRAFLSDSGTHG